MNEETMQEWSDTIERSRILRREELRREQAELDEVMESLAEQDAKVCDCWSLKNFAEEYVDGLRVIQCQECGAWH